MSPTRPVVAASLAASLVALLAGCGTGPSSTGTGPADQSPVPAAREDRDAPLEGVWQAGPLSVAQTEATLRRHGLGQWVADYRRNAPFSVDTVLTLTIEGGAWDLYGQAGDGPAEPIDYDAEYEIAGNTVTFHHSDGSNTYRWAIAGDTLSLELVGSTMPDYRGIPDEVFQRALYTTEEFTRQD